VFQIVQKSLWKETNLAGKLKLVGFLAKGKIEKSIGEVMDALAKMV